MRAVIMTMVLASLALGGCDNKQQESTTNETLSLDDGMPNQVAGNADIETLPADESSTTPSNQLQNGFDDADVNDVGVTNSE